MQQRTGRGLIVTGLRSAAAVAIIIMIVGIPADDDRLATGTMVQAAEPADSVDAAEAATAEANDTASPAVEAKTKPSTPSQPGARPEKKPAPRYTTRRNHDPNGIGKFYMGREIAHVMGFSGVGWLERSNREDEERTSLLIESLKLKPGMTIADIGSGSGVITVPMARAVGPEGKVYAVDIQQEMLDRLGDKLNRLELTNVELILGKPKSPRLPADVVDLAIMVDVYHEFEFPYEMMLELCQSLKPGGQLVFVEFRREDPQVPIKLIHKMTVDQVKREALLPEFGLQWKETIGVLPWQHIIIFEKQPADPAAE
jgi:precorrin-6B methylase 2